MQILLPRSHGRSKPIKFFQRRPVPPHPDPESQRVDISKPPTSHEWRPLCRVCVAAWDLTDPPSSQCTSPAHGHPRVVYEMASNLPSTIDLTQSLHMAGIDEGTGHARSARRSSDDRNIKNTITILVQDKCLAGGPALILRVVRGATCLDDLGSKPLTPRRITPERSRRALQMSNLARLTGRSPKEVTSDRAKRVAKEPGPYLWTILHGLNIKGGTIDNSFSHFRFTDTVHPFGATL